MVEALADLKFGFYDSYPTYLFFAAKRGDEHDSNAGSHGVF